MQALGDIDPVAVDVLSIHHDVAEIDADPEYHAIVLGDHRFGGQHAPLNGDRAVDGIDHAGELHQRAIPHQLDDAAIVRGDAGVDQVAPQRFEAAQRVRLVDLHQAAEADHIG